MRYADGLKVSSLINRAPARGEFFYATLRQFLAFPDGQFVDINHEKSFILMYFPAVLISITKAALVPMRKGDIIAENPSCALQN
jgi:hypothetical protein